MELRSNFLPRTRRASPTSSPRGRQAPNISRLTSVRPAAKPDAVPRVATRRWWKRDLPPLSPSLSLLLRGRPAARSPAPIPSSPGHALGRPLYLEPRHPRSGSSARGRQPTALKGKAQRQPPGGGSAGGRRNLKVRELLRSGVAGTLVVPVFE